MKKVTWHLIPRDCLSILLLTGLWSGCQRLLRTQHPLKRP